MRGFRPFILVFGIILCMLLFACEENGPTLTKSDALLYTVSEPVYIVETGVWEYTVYANEGDRITLEMGEDTASSEVGSSGFKKLQIPEFVLLEMLDMPIEKEPVEIAPKIFIETKDGETIPLDVPLVTIDIPAATPAPSSTPVLEEGHNDAFVDAYTSLGVTPDTARTLYGVQVNGSREGTVLEAAFTYVGEEETEYMGAEGEIRLHLPNGSASSAAFKTALPTGSTCGFSLQCIDLDGDGTDEICLFYEFWNTALLGDLHIYKIMPDGLVEIGAALTDSDKDTAKLYKGLRLQGLESCAGIMPIETSDGILLRIYEYAHIYDTRYAEYTFRDNKWRMVRPVAAKQAHNPPQEALERWELYDFSASPEDEEGPYIPKLGQQCWDIALDIDSIGVKKDRLYMYEAEVVSWGKAAQDNIDTDILMLEYERDYGSGERFLLGYFEGLQRRPTVTVYATDEAGVEEIKLLLQMGDHEETRIWKVGNGQVKEQLPAPTP